MTKPAAPRWSDLEWTSMLNRIDQAVILGTYHGHGKVTNGSTKILTEVAPGRSADGVYHKLLHELKVNFAMGGSAHIHRLFTEGTRCLPRGKFPEHWIRPMEEHRAKLQLPAIDVGYQTYEESLSNAQAANGLGRRSEDYTALERAAEQEPARNSEGLTSNTVSDNRNGEEAEDEDEPEIHGSSTSGSVWTPGSPTPDVLEPELLAAGSPQQNIPIHAGHQLLRTPRCRRCRKKKTKCERVKGAKSCNPCNQAGVECLPVEQPQPPEKANQEGTEIDEQPGQPNRVKKRKRDETQLLAVQTHHDTGEPSHPLTKKPRNQGFDINSVDEDTMIVISKGSNEADDASAVPLNNSTSSNTITPSLQDRTIARDARNQNLDDDDEVSIVRAISNIQDKSQGSDSPRQVLKLRGCRNGFNEPQLLPSQLSTKPSGQPPTASMEQKEIEELRKQNALVHEENEALRRSIKEARDDKAKSAEYTERLTRQCTWLRNLVSNDRKWTSSERDTIRMIDRTLENEKLTQDERVEVFTRDLLGYKKNNERLKEKLNAIIGDQHLDDVRLPVNPSSDDIDLNLDSMRKGIQQVGDNGPIYPPEHVGTQTPLPAPGRLRAFSHQVDSFLKGYLSAQGLMRYFKDEMATCPTNPSIIQTLSSVLLFNLAFVDLSCTFEEEHSSTFRTVLSTIATIDPKAARKIDLWSTSARIHDEQLQSDIPNKSLMISQAITGHLSAVLSVDITPEECRPWCEPAVRLAFDLLKSDKAYETTFCHPGIKFDPETMVAEDTDGFELPASKCDGKLVRLCLFPAIFQFERWADYAADDITNALVCNKSFFRRPKETAVLDSKEVLYKARVLLEN